MVKEDSFMAVSEKAKEKLDEASREWSLKRAGRSLKAENFEAK
jgi:hypothetical protein